jgi:hypothetical protein
MMLLASNELSIAESAGMGTQRDTWPLTGPRLPEIVASDSQGPGSREAKNGLPRYDSNWTPLEVDHG